jgi:hypothetical protein
MNTTAKMPDWYKDAINSALEKHPSFDLLVQKVDEVRAKHIELMAAAFCLQTGLPPDECELEQYNDGLTIRWRFVPRIAVAVKSA